MEEIMKLRLGFKLWNLNLMSSVLPTEPVSSQVLALNSVWPSYPLPFNDLFTQKDQLKDQEPFHWLNQINLSLQGVGHGTKYNGMVEII